MGLLTKKQFNLFLKTLIHTNLASGSCLAFPLLGVTTTIQEAQSQQPHIALKDH